MYNEENEEKLLIYKCVILSNITSQDQDPRLLMDK